MSTSAILLLADGFEEIEATTALDVLRRAGFSICSASLSKHKIVTGARGIALMADETLESLKDQLFQLVILPGGIPGADNLRNDPRLPGFLKNHYDAGAHLAAICAAPYILGELGYLKGRKATSYPTFRDRLEGADILDQKVVEDGPITTSQGVGTALDFALHLVARFEGAEKARELSKAMVIPNNLFL